MIEKSSRVSKTNAIILYNVVHLSHCVKVDGSSIPGGHFFYSKRIRHSVE